MIQKYRVCVRGEKRNREKKQNNEKKLFFRSVQEMRAFVSESLVIGELKIYRAVIFLKMSLEKITRSNFHI